jgi:hypothetical protein
MIKLLTPLGSRSRIRPRVLNEAVLPIALEILDERARRINLRRVPFFPTGSTTNPKPVGSRNQIGAARRQLKDSIEPQE